MKKLILPLAVLLFLSVAVVCTVKPEWVEAVVYSQSELTSLVIVEESSERTPTQRAIYFSPDLQPYRDAKILRLVDKDGVGVNIGEVQWAIDACKGKPLPLWCFKRGNSATVVSPPADVKAAIALIKRYGG